jgi:predicted ATPase
MPRRADTKDNVPPALYLVELLTPALTVRSLGGGVTRGIGGGERVLTRFRTQKTAALLAFMAVHPGRHMREVLADRLWPDLPTTKGRESLSVALSALRSQLELPGMGAGSVIVSDRVGVGLCPGAVTTDVARFEALLNRAGAATERAERIALLRQAVALHHGNGLLPGHYDDWIVPFQERLADRCCHALLTLAEYEADQGAFEVALALARRAQAFGDEEFARPFAEAAATFITRIEARTGGVRERPLSSVASATTVLASPIAPAVTPPPPVEMPPPEPSLAPSRVPAPLTRFFGRVPELDRLRRWAQRLPGDIRTDVRLVTLTGPGGSGKTRLTRELVRILADQAEVAEHGEALTFAADLTAVTNPAFLPDAVSSALGLPPPAAGEDATERLARLLAEAPSPLLCLDNLEQLLPDASLWVEDLLGRVPGLRCLITSRVRLGVPGEVAFPVEPLPVPPALPQAVALIGDSGGASEYHELLGGLGSDPAALLMEWSSVALFVDRAQHARPDFRLTARNAGTVARLVEALDGLPLAIELAAARSQVLTPEDMLLRLSGRRFDVLARRRRGRNDRHASLHETLAWSVDMLPPGPKAALLRLSVFRGGWTLEAAEAVTGTASALDDLAHLCDASLVRVQSEPSADGGETRRFFLLEAVREFAAERLGDMEEGAEAEACARHGAFFEALAVGAVDRLKGSGPEQAAWVERLRADHDNLHSALTRSMSAPAVTAPNEARRALALGWALHRYWLSRGLLSLGRAHLTAAIACGRRSPTPDATLLVRALSALALLAQTQGDNAEARRRWRQAAWITRRHGVQGRRGTEATEARDRLAALWNNLGTVAYGEQCWADARRWFEASLPRWRERGDRAREGVALANLAGVAFEQGRLTEAQALYEDAIRLAQETGDRRGEGTRLVNQGQVLARRGDLDGAERLYRRGLTLLEGGYAHVRAAVLLNLGLVAAERGDAERADWLLASAEEVFRRESVPLPPFVRREFARLEIIAAGDADRPRAAAPLPLDEAVARVLAETRDGERSDEQAQPYSFPGPSVSPPPKSVRVVF